MFKIIVFLIILIILFIPNYANEINLQYLDKYSIKNNNFTIFNLDNYDIQNQITKNKIIPSIEDKVLKLLPHDYKFLDYSHEIKNSSLYTFHRDVMSSKISKI